MTGAKQMKANGVVVRTPDGVNDSPEEEFFNNHVAHTYNNT